MKKQFKIDSADIKKLIPDMGTCFATDMITIDGKKVGYMYRETPDRENDSGWRFFSGDETQEYVDDLKNIDIYEVNTLANYDPDIIPLLNSPIDSAFERDPNTSDFIEVKA